MLMVAFDQRLWSVMVSGHLQCHLMLNHSELLVMVN